MIDFDTWSKAWALLDARERRSAWVVLGAVIISALSSALMVGSILPFLSVLADPSLIETVPVLVWAYESFNFGSDYSFLIGLGLASFGVIVITSLIQITKTWAVARFAMMRIHTLSHRLLATYLCQPYVFFLDRHSGEMGTRILSESEQAVNQFFRPAAELIAASLTIIAILGLLLAVEPVVALSAFALLSGLYGGVYALSRRALRQYGKVRVAANSVRFRIANEALSGIKDIKLLGRERSYLARYAQPSRSMAGAVVAVQVISQVPQFMLQAVAFGGIILLCLLLMDAQALASGEALGGILPVLGIFAFAGQRLMPELSKLYRSLALLQAGAGAVHTVYEDLVERASVGRLPKTMPHRLGLTREVKLQNVCFNYPDALHAGVVDIDLEIRAGERVGVVGGTGAGKTTLADIILGLLTPSHGRLIVDGILLGENNLRAWQQSLGYVPQNIFLIDASISENIALGVPPHEIDEVRVRRVAEIAQIDKFIREDLPEGYATAIGERGVRLSGGQRQRVGIARALYHEADFIVFDEATSALDNLTEYEVMASIDALPGDKTVLMIAHRLSTVKHCDRIIVLDRGRLVGCGTWEALKAENPSFRKIASVSEPL